MTERVWNGTNFKQPRISQKVQRGIKRQARDLAEEKNKREVRRRDKKCRFALCGCHRFRLAKHVAHLKHKGIGGDPDGERSLPMHMIQVCIARHREHAFSIDKKTIECRPLTKSGTNGPVAWWIDMREVERLAVVDWRLVGDGWRELARERAVNVLEPLIPWQLSLLESLAEMLV